MSARRGASAGTAAHVEIRGLSKVYEAKSETVAALDDIALTIEKGAAIDAFEDRQRAAQPWLYG